MKKYDFLNHYGFTIIELIAVMVILGILATLGVPKFFDMQTQARQNAVNGTLAALQSTATQEYAKCLLKSPSNTIYSPTSPVVVGDFTGRIMMDAGDIVVVTVTDGPKWWNSTVTENSKSFRLY